MVSRKQANEVRIELYGKRWRATLNWKGVRLRPTFDTRDEAEAWGNEQTIRMIRGQDIELPVGAKSYATTGVPTTIGELFEHTQRVHWLVGGPNGGPQKSWPKTEIAATLAIEAIGRNTRLSKLSVPIVENALRALEEKRGNTPRTTNRRIAALSVMFKEAVRLGAMPTVLPLKKAPECKEGRVFRITPAIEHEMLTWALANDREDFYDFLVFSLYLGQRENETLRLRLSESFGHPRDGYMDGVDFAIFPRGVASNKSTLTRAIPARAIVAEVVLRHRAKGKTKEARILDGLTKDKVAYAFAQMKADLLAQNHPDIVAQKRDGLPIGKDFVIHIMRNEFCSRLGDEGFTVAEIAEFSGHTDLKTCARYVKPNKVAHRARLLRKGKLTSDLPGGAVPSYAPT
ncbi:hypothetical protein, partial [Methylorubrum zatmanii]